MRRLYAIRRAKGLCYHCDTPARPGRTKCTVHANYYVRTMQERNQEHEATGICRRCHKDPVTKENNFNTNSVYCSKCLKLVSSKLICRSKENVVRGLCKCGLKRAGKTKLCFKHLITSKLRRALKRGPTKIERQLIVDKLSSLDHKCAYSGKELVMGVNATLDHIIPISKNGERSINNLTWADDSVNRAKRAMLVPEFLEMCQMVVRWAQ